MKRPLGRLKQMNKRMRLRARELGQWVPEQQKAAETRYEAEEREWREK